MSFRNAQGALAVFVLVAVVLVACPVAAQESTDPGETEAHKKLNAEAADAVSRGDYDRAILLLRSSLEIRQLNVTWLNLGRTFARAGRCSEARAAYDDVHTAIPVDDPPAAQIDALAEQYRDQLETECFSYIELECEPASMKVEVDGEGHGTCAAMGTPLEVDPGPHSLRGLTPDGKVREVDVRTLPGQTINVTIDPDAERAVRVVDADTGESIGPLPPAPPAPIVERPWFWGTVVGGTGAAVLVAATVVDVVVIQPDIEDLRALATTADRQGFDALEDDIDRNQAINLGLFIGGGVLVAGGVAAIIVDLVFLDDADAAETPNSDRARLDIAPMPAGGASVGVTLKW